LLLKVYIGLDKINEVLNKRVSKQNLLDLHIAKRWKRYVGCIIAKQTFLTLKNH